jgi:hypothetical protein
VLSSPEPAGQLRRCTLPSGQPWRRGGRRVWCPGSAVAGSSVVVVTLLVFNNNSFSWPAMVVRERKFAVAVMSHSDGGRGFFCERITRLAWRPRQFLESCAGARRLLATKWLVPGGVEMAGGSGSSSKEVRALLPLFSAARLPRGRRRLVAEMPKHLIAFLSFVWGCFM